MYTRKRISMYIYTNIFEQIELPAKLLDCFSWSTKSNINQCYDHVYFTLCTHKCEDLLHICIDYVLLQNKGMMSKMFINNGKS